MSPFDVQCSDACVAMRRPVAIAPQREERLCELLKQVPLFDSLGCEDIARLAHDVREIEVARGEVLFHRGDICHGFHLILSGQIKLAFTSAEGNEKVVEILHAGQTFGEAVMLMEMPYVVMAQALTDTRLMLIGKQALFDQLALNPVFCRRVLAGLARRLHGLMHDVESYSLRSGRERVIGYLLRVDESDGETTSRGGVSLRLPAAKSTIASRLNLTPEHFSRILHELCDAQLIRVEGRTIHVTDIARLRHSLG